MIEIRGLQKKYTMNNEDLIILDIDRLDIEKGELVSVIGPSGCGKTTLLHIIGGVISPEQGSVMINGTDIAGKREKERDEFRAHHIGYIFQDFYLIPSMTAEENVKLVLPKMNKNAEKALLGDWFEKVGLSDRRNHRPYQLSRGQQQRIAIIRAMINQPAIVLADEPTGSLDYETAGQMMDLLLKLCAENKQTLLCVTHDLPLAQLFPRVIRMENCNKKLIDRRVTA
jgi:putative ABC transport system ATP-binding protein